MNNEQHWMTDYLDDFDNECQSFRDCSDCPVYKLRAKFPEKTCFRLYCESKDAKRNKTKPSAGKTS